LAKQKQLDRAVQVLEQAGAWIQNPTAVTRMTYAVYDTVAMDLTKQSDWQGAVDVYAKALEAKPDDKHLVDNAVATWNGWAQHYIKAKSWPEAIEVYKKGLERFPGNKTFTNNVKYCEQQMKKAGGNSK
jgi:tetratricopeptide (TPR) repeat protein